MDTPLHVECAYCHERLTRHDRQLATLESKLDVLLVAEGKRDEADKRRDEVLELILELVRV